MLSNLSFKRIFLRKLYHVKLRLSSRHQFQQIDKVNLLYHIAPLNANDVWKENIRILKPHLPKFSRIIVGVVTGSEMEPPELVMDELRPYTAEFVIRPNDRLRGEGATFLEMLNLIASTEVNEASVYAHAKGVSRPGNKAVEMWRNALYSSCFDDFDFVRKIMERYACAGPFKMVGNSSFDGLPSLANFIFAGTFFWFRHDQLFLTEGWNTLQEHRHSVEEYIGRFFGSNLAAGLYGDYPHNLYTVSGQERCESLFFNTVRIFGHPLKNVITRRNIQRASDC